MARNAPVAIAYLIIKAKGENLDRDIHEMSEKAATRSGEQSGKTFAEKYHEAASRNLRGRSQQWRHLLAGSGTDTVRGFGDAARARFRHVRRDLEDDADGAGRSMGERLQKAFSTRSRGLGERFKGAFDGGALRGTGRLLAGLSDVGGMLKMTRAMQGVISLSPKLALGLGVGLQAIGPLAAGFAHAAVSLTRWSAAVAPAAAALVPLTAGLLFLKSTLGAVGASIGESLSPLSDAFKKAQQHAGDLAQKGIAPLAKASRDANMPAISKAMDRVGVASNKAAKSFLKFTTTGAGRSAIASIVNSAARAFEVVAPAAERAAEAVTKMAGRLAPRTFAVVGNAVKSLADKITELADKTDDKDLQTAFSKIGELGSRIKSGIGAIIDVTKWLDKNRESIGHFADGLGIASVAIGVFTGNPLLALGSGLLLLIRHWGDVTSYFRNNPVGKGIFDNLQKAADTVLPALSSAFKTVSDIVGPPLAKLRDSLMGPGGLGEAFGQFVAAAAPLVAFFAKVLAPIVGVVLDLVISKIQGFVNIATGVFQVLTGILTGNWSKAWDGVKNIAEGAVQLVVGKLLALPGKALKALAPLAKRLPGFFGGLASSAGSSAGGIVVAAARVLGRLPGRALSAVAPFARRFGSWLAGLAGRAGRGAVSLASRFVSGIASLPGRAGRVASALVSRFMGFLSRLPGRAADAAGKVKGRITGAFSGAGGWLLDAGRRIMRGLIDGISSKFDAVKSKLSSLTSKIPDWKGPAEVDAKLLIPNGQTVIRSFMKGIDREIPALRTQLGGVTASIPTMTVPRTRLPKQASRGLDDLSRAYGGRQAPTPTASAPGMARLNPDDVRLLAVEFARTVGRMSVRLSDGAVAGVVDRTGGRRL